MPRCSHRTAVSGSRMCTAEAVPVLRPTSITRSITVRTSGPSVCPGTPSAMARSFGPTRAASIPGVAMMASRFSTAARVSTCTMRKVSVVLPGEHLGHRTGAELHVAEPQRAAARPLRRVLHGPHHAGHLGGGLDARGHDAERPRVQRLRDPGIRVIGDPHDRGDVQQARRAAELRDALDAEHPVLVVDDDEVEPAVGQDLEHRGLAELYQEHADRRLSLGEEALEPVGPDEGGVHGLWCRMEAGPAARDPVRRILRPDSSDTRSDDHHREPDPRSGEAVPRRRRTGNRAPRKHRARPRARRRRGGGGRRLREVPARVRRRDPPSPFGCG